MAARRIGDLSPARTHYWNGDIWGWQPLWLAPAEVLAVARDRFDVTASSATFLGSGLLNQSWTLTTPERRLILRVSRAERTLAQIAYEHAVLLTLHEEIGQIVPPLAGTDGDTIQRADRYLVSLFPFIVGASGAEVPAAIRAPAAAATLARIHRVSIDSLRLPQRPGFRAVDECPRWVWPEVKPVLRDALGGNPAFAALSDAIEREIATLDRWLDTLQAAGRLMPRAVVHGDFNPRNLLFQGDRLAAIIDWDDCHIEPIAWEVAQAAFAPGVDPHAFWRAWRAAGGPLDDADVDLLGGFARIGALSELRWTLDERGQATPHALQQLRAVVQDVDERRQRAGS